ncbi:Hermansky-Pudlak syndrome 3 [Nesidiocoris tenuis]|uniref:Hermansky-Pudlak syndrome 3 n=1 Tax=Nesidiocoris tenuis TaxID=355587 RepID=A0ABN7AID0_9HEMI|nr:Hermansky-Pudlak syndrome 3 [Nesidiocoris tenuis]
MVRVISVHHFDSQVIKTCEEPLAATSAPPDRILAALPHHVIEVHDLSQRGQASFSFPTVDRVHELQYCLTGNYVATLEKKQTRQGKEVTYARVYTNWDKRTETDLDQAMRARIAGRVTPSSSQTGVDVLEMIELPVRFPTVTALTCCQETGNVLVGSENIICVFQLVTRTHDISRQKFLDFELWPVTLELSFTPSRLKMAEDVVAAMSLTCLHVFRINKGFARPTDWTSTSPRKSNQHKNAANSKKKEEANKRPDSPIRLGDLLKEVSEVGGKQHETLKISNGSLPVLALLPSLTTGSLVNNPARNLRNSPFKPPSAVVMGVAIREIPANEPWAEQMTTMVESLLQLELGDWGEGMVKDEFKCLALRPLYRIKTKYPSKNESSCPRFRSAAYCNLVAFNCVVSTQQEGFMYHFPVSDGEVLSLGKCISEYNFTSAVKHIILEPYLLHALTSTGLETYTTRAIHAIDEENEELACPPLEEPVCLVGLRSFIGVVDVQITNSFIVIMSSSSDPHNKYENHEETLYCLKLPTAGRLYTDMMALGSSHRFSSPQTYWQLLIEAHCVLRSITSVSTDPDFKPHQVELDLFRESCALLAEYYLCSFDDEDDWNIGYKYTLMAELTPTQLMERLKKLGVDAKRVNCKINYNGGLLHYLRLCLIACDDESKMPVNALNTLLDMLDVAAVKPVKPFLLSSLVLESSLLRQFSNERSIRMISTQVKESKKDVEALDCLALAVLYTSKQKTKEAGEALDLCKDPDQYINLLSEYWHLLFDNSRKLAKVTPDDWEDVTLSELSVLLIDKKPLELSTVLSRLVTDSNTLKLRDILEVFLVYLPARMGREGTKVGHVLQLFLEGVFHKLHENDASFFINAKDDHYVEALNILMRSLLSGLVVKNVSRHDTMIQNGDPRLLFGGKRHKFLNLLPPCSDPDFVPETHSSLLKLQCLMCTKWLNESALAELVQFVGEFVEVNYGLSLMVLAQPQKAVALLLERNPPALLQYVADMLTTEAELKHVVTLVQAKADDEVDLAESGSKTYSELLDKLLNQLARTLNCELFNRIVPPGKEFDCYKMRCRQTEHANHIKEMIMVTGHRFMAQMNMKSFT